MGIDIGFGEEASSQFRTASEQVESLHSKLETLGDCPVELALLRQCADSCKITHLLRAAGPRIDGAALRAFDRELEVALQRTLGCPLPAAAAAQAALAESFGGLGMRQASELAEAAFIASRVDAQPFVHDLVAGFAMYFGHAAEFLETWERDLAQALARVGERMSAASRAEVAEHVQSAAADAAARSAQVWCGSRPGGEDRARRLHAGAEALVHQGEVVLDSSAEKRLQSRITDILDAQGLDALLASLSEAEDHNGARRLRDLGDSLTDHSWLDALNPATGAALRSEEYRRAVVIRLGGGSSSRRPRSALAAPGASTAAATTRWFAREVNPHAATTTSATPCFSWRRSRTRPPALSPLASCPHVLSSVPPTCSPQPPPGAA